MKKKLFLLTIALLCTVVQGAWAQNAAVTFIDRQWDETNMRVVDIQKTITDYTVLNGSHPEEWIELTDGYYVVNGDVEYRVLNITGSDVHLVLADGCGLNCWHVKLEQGHSLHIYAQSDGDTKGRLCAENNEKTGTYFKGAAAIGGGAEQNSGSLYVHGGYVKAWVNTVSYTYGDAAIGGGKNHCIGGEVVIYGGKVDAIGRSGAGIGGGEDGSQGGPVTIYGGDVSAKAEVGGAGIGGGYGQAGGTVYIYGGSVSATGSDFFLEGGSELDADEDTEIYAAGIGFGYYGNSDAGDIHIYGGTISAKGGATCLLSGSVEIADGLMVATNDGRGPVMAADRVRTCQSVPNKYTLQILPCTHSGDFTYSSIGNTKHRSVCTYCGFAKEEDHTLNKGVCVCGFRYATTLEEVLLIDTQDNNSKLASNNGKEANVTLFGRTLYMDGSWNTLCLPFDVADIYDTPLASLEGVIVKTLSSSDYDGTTKTLTLNFSDATSSLKAGVPYIIKWNATGDPINRPRFECVTISNTLTPATSDYVDFVGSFSPVTLTAKDKSVLYLGADNKLYYPSSDMTVGSCRALFQLNGITAGDQPAGTRSFVLNFGDGETTTGIIGIGSTRTDTDKNDGYWYDLQGRKLSGKPTQKGIYINHGNKVVIK